MYSFQEFFAGGGMVRAGLGPEWRCQFANDFDAKKGAAYAENWGANTLMVGDVAGVPQHALGGQADLAWGSFPCQDLSQAGGQIGLAGGRSGAFWPFWRLMQGQIASGHGPRIIALENVCGAITANGGADLRIIFEAMAAEGYRYGAMVINADLWTPQSRPRLFIIAARHDVDIASVTANEPDATWTPKALRAVLHSVSDHARDHQIWWRMPVPAPRAKDLSDILEDAPTDVKWHTAAETAALIAMMSPANRAKLDAAVARTARDGGRMAGGVYRRTRNGVQRAEVRFDGVAGCLRTPTGGSSRQMLLIVEPGSVRSRLISARETARLMGIPENYKLPAGYNDAYHLTGDGVAVPVVRALAANIFEPMLRKTATRSAIASGAAGVAAVVATGVAASGGLATNHAA